MSILRYAAWVVVNTFAVIGGVFVGIFGGLVIWGFFH